MARHGSFVDQPDEVTLAGQEAKRGNEVRLLIASVAYEVMHIAHRAIARATGTGWSLRRLPERVFRHAACESVRRMVHLVPVLNREPAGDDA